MLVIHLAWRNVLRHLRRSMASVFAIVFGIAALLLASGFIAWNLDYGREATIHSQLGHLRLQKPGYLAEGAAQPFEYLLPLTPAQLRQLEMQPAVEAVAPRLAFNGLISHDDASLSFIAEGVEPLPEKKLSRSLTVTAGEGLSEQDPKGIILGRGLAANLGVEPGAVVVLMATTRNGGMNAVEAHVRGVFSTITKAYDDAALRLPIALARQLLRVDGAHTYAVLLDDTAATDTALARLRVLPGLEQLEWVPWYQMADFYRKTVKLLTSQVAVVQWIIALIIVLSISNALAMSVRERTAEIGTMMAMGDRRSVVLQLFLWEGLLLGVLGGLLGVVIGALAAKLISMIGIPMPPPPGMASGYTAAISLNWGTTVQAFVLAVMSALIASAYPAWKASRLEVVNALRHNH